MPISEEDAAVIIEKHIVDVVTVSDSIVTNRQNAIIGVASYDSQYQHDDIPADKMRNNLLSIQKELVPELLADMKAGKDRSEQVVDRAMCAHAG